jgi:Ca2+-binding RTX toxin-like protein
VIKAVDAADDNDADQIFGQGGDDVLRGGGDDDELYGGGGSDFLDGEDDLLGGIGDLCVGADGVNTLVDCERTSRE